MEQYQDIIFLQESAANEAMEILEKLGEHSVLEYLKQWDNGDGGFVRDLPSYGEGDRVYRENDYILSYNLGLPYIGLEKVIRGGNNEQI